MNDKLKMDWIINGLLAVILVLISGSYLQNYTAKAAHAEGPGDGGGWATNGIMVHSTSGQAERLVLVDTRKQNIMIYHAQAGGRFGLSGARNYKYDVEIEDTETVKARGPGMTFFTVKEIYEATKK